MKKRKTKTAARKQPAQPVHKAAAANPPPASPSRRNFVKTAGSWSILAIAGGGLAWYAATEVMASMGEQNLGKIGNGTPAVVQIHDPNCSMCATLMQEARTAMKSFDDGELQYLVANIKSDEGRTLAAQHGVPHVTLLLFDGQGNMHQAIRGIKDSTYLTNAFKRHLATTS